MPRSCVIFGKIKLDKIRRWCGVARSCLLAHQTIQTQHMPAALLLFISWSPGGILWYVRIESISVGPVPVDGDK